MNDPKIMERVFPAVPNIAFIKIVKQYADSKYMNLGSLNSVYIALVTYTHAAAKLN